MTGLLATSSPRARSRSPRKTKPAAPSREPLAIEIELIAPEDLESVAARLGEILLAQVGKGSSVNFVHPFREEEAAELFRKVAVGRGPGRALLWVARAPAQGAREKGTQNGEGEGKGEEKGEEKGSDKGEIIGTVQLGFHISPNGRHRADVRKLLVHPDYERRGVARRLMEVLEEEARAAKTKLLVSYGLNKKVGSGRGRFSVCVVEASICPH